MSRFPVFKVRGGPEAAKCTVELDGRPLPGVTRVGFSGVADVHDGLCRVDITLIAELDVELAADVHVHYPVDELAKQAKEPSE